MRRATCTSAGRFRNGGHFYPRPPRGGRPGRWHGSADGSDFYPRPPRGGRLIISAKEGAVKAFLSTPSAGRATELCATSSPSWRIFLSTPSARRATVASVSCAKELFYFYPRPPRGGRPPRAAVCGRCQSISIHALREEGDPDRPRPAGLYSAFLSTPSARRATVSSPFAPSFVRISIHALREEGDRVAYYLDMGLGKISIHALREEGDTGGTFAVIDPGVFLSTPSARRATILPSFPYAGIFAFLSTPSARRATKSLIGSNPNLIISIHALCEEGDLTFDAGGVALKAFLSTPSARRATLSQRLRVVNFRFLSTPSARRATARTSPRG